MDGLSRRSKKLPGGYAGKILQVEPSLVDPQLLAALSRIEELLTRIEHNTDPEWQRR